jgi:hypothetical protein
MRWKAGKLASAQIRGATSGPRRLRSGEKIATISLKAGETLNLNADLVGEHDAKDQR